MMKRYNFNRLSRLTAIAVFLGLIAYAFIVYANPDGRTGRTASNSAGCGGGGCHGSSSSTSTTINVTSGSGSFTVSPNSTTTFTVTVSNSGRPTCGINIAVKTSETGTTNAGSLSPETGSGLQSVSGELTQTTPKSFNGGTVDFSFTWTAPSTPGTYYLRAIANAVNGNGSADAGDQWNWMTVQQIVVSAQPSVSLTAPVGGESWCPGSTHNITWTATAVTNVNIDLSTDGGSTFGTSLATNVSASSGTWSWNIPAGQAIGNQYKVRVSDASNSATTSISNVFSVPGSVSISTHPVNQSVCSGNQVSFSITASGSGLRYQWRKNTININNANSSTYTISSVAGADSGKYECQVSGDCGNPVTSNQALLAVDISPKFLSQPSSATICPGESVTLSVTAEGTNLTFQWRKNGSDISGANSATYSLNNVSTSDSGNYDVVINGKCNAPQTSQTAIVKINAAPEIVKQPANVNACLGGKAIIFTSAKGSGLSFKWFRNGTEITNSNNDTLYLNNISANDEGNYEVKVSGICTPAVTSNGASLFITTATTISQQPIDQTVTEGSDIDFTVTAKGLNLKYQWRKAGSNLSGKTTADLHLKSVAKSDSGNYDCVVTGDCGSETSKAVKLTVKDAGNGPNLSLQHTTIDFGNVFSGNSKDSVFTGLIKNTGNQDLIISSIQLIGTDAANFQILSNTVPQTIKPAESANFEIKFSPVSAGVKQCQIAFTSNSSQNPQLQLTGVGATDKFALDVSSLVFQTTSKDQPVTKSFLIENQGNVDLNFELTLTGNDNANFSILSEKSVIISAGKSSSVSIQYNPGASSTSNAEINVKVLETGLTQKVTLKGSIVTDVFETTILNDMKIYPNPANSNIHIVFNVERNTSAQISIVDLNGNIIKDYGLLSLSAGQSGLIWNGLDLAGNKVAAGHYILSVITANNKISYPVILK